MDTEEERLDEERRRSKLTDLIMEKPGNRLSRSDARMVVDISCQAVDEGFTRLLEVCKLAPDPAFAALLAFKSLKATVGDAIEMAFNQVTGSAADASGCPCPECTKGREMIADGAKIIDKGDGFMILEIGK